MRTGIRLFVMVLSSTALSWSQGLRVEGTAVGISGSNLGAWTTSSSSIVYINAQSLRKTVLMDAMKFGSSANFGAPAFSPDGKKVAFFAGREIYAINNDGTGLAKLCERYTDKDHLDLSWCTDGYVYWSEFTNDIYRCNVLTRQREIYWSSVGVEGYDGTPVVEVLSVSRDGKRGESNSHGMVHLFDMVNKKALGTTSGGCRASISGSGEFIIHPHTCCISSPPGISSYSQWCALYRFTERTITGTVFCPGQPNGPENARWVDLRGPINTDEYLVGTGLDLYDGKGLIVGVSNSAYAWLSDHFKPNDFWLGPLPSPVTSGPQIAIDKSALTFSASGGATPSVQTVLVTNSGSGTLAAVTVTGNTDWLAVTPSGTGNTQTLSNAVTAAGLESGAYYATVSVSGGGASNAQTYLVTLTVGTTLHPPTELSGTPLTEDSVRLTWKDNTGDETGFDIERKSGTASWVMIGTVAANVTTFIDGTAFVGTISYRVRAIKGTEYSGYSLPADVVVREVVAITITSPVNGQELVAGSTIRITWTTNSNAVKIGYSTDAGLTWNSILTDAALSSTEPRWGNFPWTVAAHPGDTLIIEVMDYADPLLQDAVGPLPVTAAPDPALISRGKIATASSEENTQFAGNLPAANAVDGSPTTRWGSSPGSDSEWICIDLGSVMSFGRIILSWEAAYAQSYAIQASGDAKSWTDVYRTTAGNGGIDTIEVKASGRYVRMLGTARGTEFGYSLFEFAIYQLPSATVTARMPIRGGATFRHRSIDGLTAWASAHPQSEIVVSDPAGRILGRIDPRRPAGGSDLRTAHRGLYVVTVKTGGRRAGTAMLVHP